METIKENAANVYLYITIIKDYTVLKTMGDNNNATSNKQQKNKTDTNRIELY